MSWILNLNSVKLFQEYDLSTFVGSFFRHLLNDGHLLEVIVNLSSYLLHHHWLSLWSGQN